MSSVVLAFTLAMIVSHECAVAVLLGLIEVRHERKHFSGKDYVHMSIHSLPHTSVAHWIVLVCGRMQDGVATYVGQRVQLLLDTLGQ